ncbi:MAG: hypothetical protein AAGA28_09235 [Pseudomonadota bacterium]
MYSARIVNSLASKPPAGVLARGDALAERLPAQESMLQGMGGVFVNRDGDFSLQGREAWLFISIKNRGFRRAYIDRFIEMCEINGIAGHICPVDDPYRYNAMADLRCDTLPEEEAAKIERLSTDITRMAQKALNGKRSTRVDLVKWRDLEADTPAQYRQELTQAFRNGTRVRDILRSHVCSVKPVDSERSFERYSEFFLCEVPVLIHTYYSRGPTLDIYPGPQPKLFWQIELGDLETELPGLTALSRSCRPMLYFDTHDRSGKRLA